MGHRRVPRVRAARWALPAAAILLLGLETSAGAASPLRASIGRSRQSAVATLWEGADRARRSRIVDSWLRQPPILEATLTALREGPRYGAVPTGRQLESHTVFGVEHPYMFLVPDDYDPARRYAVRFYLHGGVSRPDLPGNGGWWERPERLNRADAISVFPASWGASQWWQESQLRNLEMILDRLKRDYNVDENRVALFGVSDGGTGAWYAAFLNPTPWAAFVALIGHPAVLASPQVRVQGQMHVANLINRPFLAINGETDRLYPAASVQPYADLFQDAGAVVEFVTRTGAGHTVSWWSEEAERMDAFLARHPREPLPARVVIETDQVEDFNRVHWLVVDELGATDNDAVLPIYETALGGGAGSRRIGFPAVRPSGRLDAWAKGNTVTVQSQGVRAFRILVSPDQFDLDQPIDVRVNGGRRFHARVAPDVATLLRWAARDLDRTMLFAASISVTVED